MVGIKPYQIRHLLHRKSHPPHVPTKKLLTHECGDHDGGDEEEVADDYGEESPLRGPD